MPESQDIDRSATILKQDAVLATAFAEQQLANLPANVIRLGSLGQGPVAGMPSIGRCY